MELKKDIMDELNTLSPLLAGVPKVNVFTVPEGYFETVSKTVMTCLQDAEIVLPIPGLQHSVPAGYFDDLADNILNKIKSQEGTEDVTNEFSPVLLAAKNKATYQVPAGYFENLAGNILNRINVEEEIEALSTSLAKVRRLNVFDVPEGYFNNSVESIISKVTEKTAAEETRHLSPMLYSIQNENVFEVPAGYFDSLAAEILLKVKPAAKVVTMSRSNSFIKYAAAAMMAGVIAFGVYKYSDKPSTGTATTASVMKLDSAIVKGKNMNDQQFAETLGSLSATDITKYLESHGDITDMAALGISVDEAQLPDEDEYFLNDKTLENYLEKLNLTTLNN